MNFDNIDGIPLSSPALIYFPRLLQDAGAALVIKLSPKFGGKKKLGGGEAHLNGGANLIVCFTVRLLIKTSYRLVVSGVIQFFFFT